MSGLYHINAIKKAIYNKIDTIYTSTLIFYNVASKQITTGTYYIVYSLVTCEPDERILEATDLTSYYNTLFQVSVYGREKSGSSIIVDTELEKIENLFKMATLTFEDSVVNVSGTDCLPQAVNSATFNNDTKCWEGNIRFNIKFKKEVK